MFALLKALAHSFEHLSVAAAADTKVLSDESMGTDIFKLPDKRQHDSSGD